MDSRITTIITTSPVPSMPRFPHLDNTLKSLKFVRELNDSPIVVVLDAPRPECDLPLYKAYRHNIQRYCSRQENIDLICLNDWGHLSGALKAGIDASLTRFIFVQQHDLPLVRTFDLDAVIETIAYDAHVKHVRLNRRHNRPIGWDQTHIFGLYRTPYLELTKTGCWSDQSHITTTDYYEDIILPEIGSEKVFMEDVINPKINCVGSHAQRIAHETYGTFIYGPPNEPPVVTHTDGRHRIDVI